MIDLHLHLDGSLTASEIFFLAQEQGISVPADNPEGLFTHLVAPKDCSDLNMYLTCFEIPLKVLQTQKAVQYAVSTLMYRLCRQGLLYVEIRFAPQLHTKSGLSQEEVVCAALEGLNRSKKNMAADMEAGLILCMMRGDDNEGENIETVRIAKKYLEKGICAVDLAGAEGLYPTKNFESLFHMIKEQNIPFTIHAGEADGPESIRAALAYGAKRIGHGVRSLEDHTLLLQLAQEGTVLEFCPSSNVRTKAINDIEHFPIKAFLSMGIPVTINTDNMTVSNTTIEQEYQLLASKCKMTEEEKRQVLINSVNAAFLPLEKRRQLSWSVSRRLNLGRPKR